MKKSKKVISIIGNVLMWLFIVFAVVVTAFTIASTGDSSGIASIGGKSLINILTPSMESKGEHTINVGDMIIIQRISGDEVKECKDNEIITFFADLDGDGNNELNTHRIVEVIKAEGGAVSYKTRGDNNPVEDVNLVSSADIIGKYDENGANRIAGLGSVMEFLKQPTGFLLVIVLPLIAFFIFELVNFILTLRKVKGKDTISEEDREEIKRRAIEEYKLSQQQQQNNDDNHTEGNGDGGNAD